MRRSLFYLIAGIFCLIPLTGNAQVNVGSLNNPHPAAILDLSQVENENLGLLLPRVLLDDVTEFQLSGVAADGMTVFNTNENIKGGNGSGVYVWVVKQWYCLESLAPNKLKGKKISFMGNSITTYEGYIPAGYARYYPNGDVTSVDKTWWMSLVNETGMILEVNNSYSGSRVANSGNKPMCSDERLQGLGNPDIIVMLAATNDFSGNVPLGTKAKASFHLQERIDYTTTDKSTITGALIYCINQMKALYPTAEIFICSPLPRSTQAAPSNFQTKRADGLYLFEVRDRIEQLTKEMGVHFIDLYNVDLVFSYTNNDGLHPNAAGMQIVKERVKQELNLKLGSK